LASEDPEGPQQTEGWEAEVKAMSVRLARESRRSALLGFLGGVVVVGGLTFTVLATLDANNLLKFQITKNNSLKTEVTNKTAQAVAADQKAATVKSVLSTTIAGLQSQGPAISAGTTSAVDHAFDVNPIAATLLVRVYVHSHAATQHARAVAIAGALRDAGFIVPGIDVQPQSYKSTEVHYYTDDQQSLADADAIVKALAGSGVVVIKRQVPASKADHLKPRAYGLWLASTME
jgi:hypothetical protein